MPSTRKDVTNLSPRVTQRNQNCLKPQYTFLDQCMCLHRFPHGYLSLLSDSGSKREGKRREKIITQGKWQKEKSLASQIPKTVALIPKFAIVTVSYFLVLHECITEFITKLHRTEFKPNKGYEKGSQPIYSRLEKDKIKKATLTWGFFTILPCSSTKNPNPDDK